MKNNITRKLLKINLILLSIIIAIFIGFNVLGYKSYCISTDTSVPVLKSGDLILVKEYELNSSDIYLANGRKLNESPVYKDIIRFPLLGYVKNFINTAQFKSIIAFSALALMIF